MADMPFTVACIGNDALAFIVVEKLRRAGSCKHTPVSLGIVIMTSMLSVLDAVPTNSAEAVTEVHGVGAKIDPVIV